MRQRRKRLPRDSAYWKYAAIYICLIAVTFLIAGVVLGSSYLRILNRNEENIVCTQAERAIATLEAQMDSMDELCNKLSAQDIYRGSYLRETPYHRIVIARGLKQYQSYCVIADQFLLIYPESSEQSTVFTSNGTTTDMPYFLNRYGVDSERKEEVERFIFMENERARMLQLNDIILFAYPVYSNVHTKELESSILIFVIQRDALLHRIYQTSSLNAERYSLEFSGQMLTDEISASNLASVGNTDTWQINVSIQRVSLLSLLRDSRALASFLGCAILFLILAFLLAWQCYAPLRQLVEIYSLEVDTPFSNEFAQLNHAMQYLQQNVNQLSKTTSEQLELLQDYMLLMLLNNSGLPHVGNEFEKIGIVLPYPFFFVILLMPCNNEIVTEDNIAVLLRNLSEIAEDGERLYSVECERKSHTLALVCNIETSEKSIRLERHLRTYLNQIPRRFYVTSSTVTNMLGLSAAFMAAKSQLKVIATAQSNGRTKESAMEVPQLVSQLVYEIECGDCRRAMEALENCMDEMQKNPSELIRRYNIMNLTGAVQQLCSQLNYKLSDVQLSMLLPSSNMQAIHYAMLQLIPALCAQTCYRNEQAVQSMSKLVMNYLNEHFCEYDISVQKIADALGVGINRTYAFIREETGHNYKTVLNQLRIRYAKKLLRDNQISIADVASQVGYGSASYFIKVFKNAVGLPPDAYRKSLAAGITPQQSQQEKVDEIDDGEENEDI